MSKVRTFLRWAKPTSPAERWLVGLAASGFVLRFALWIASEGSNDIRSWEHFAGLVTQLGIGPTYVAHHHFNHPPLMGYFSQGALWLASFDVLGFAKVFKLPPLLAEFGSAVILMHAWRRRGQRHMAFQAVAAYGLALNCILISGFHGNTDAMYFFFALLAAHLMQVQLPLAAGLALGAAINVKLIPVLLILPLASCCDTRKNLVRYFLGLSVGALPFLLAWVFFSSESRAHMVSNMLQYRPIRDLWGVEVVVRTLVEVTRRSLSFLAGEIYGLGNQYAMHASKILFVVSGIMALLNWHLGAKRFDAYLMATLGFALLLLFGSGFGVQYVGCIVGPMLAVHVFAGSVTATVSGVFILLAYLTFVTSWWPITTVHDHRLFHLTSVAAIAWCAILWGVAVCVRAQWRREGALDARVGS